MILLDTWAWVEYFKGTKNGEKIANIIKTEQTYTSAISIAELSKWFYNNNTNIEIAINQLKETFWDSPRLGTGIIGSLYLLKYFFTVFIFL